MRLLVPLPLGIDPRLFEVRARHRNEVSTRPQSPAAPDPLAGIKHLARMKRDWQDGMEQLRELGMLDGATAPAAPEPEQGGGFLDEIEGFLGDIGGDAAKLAGVASKLKDAADLGPQISEALKGMK